MTRPTVGRRAEEVFPDECVRRRKGTGHATDQEKVIELKMAPPDDITVDGIMEELCFKSQVDEGLAQLDRGEGIPHEDAFRRILGNMA